ncbi:type II secretion system protein [bacterium]|nr:type II secretion system protein [bacterium]
MNIEEQKARGQEGKPVNPSPQPSPTRGEGVNSRVDFSLPEKLDCRASLAMTKKNSSTADAVPLPLTREVKKLAFTLAEVLITLGIIGVVAAMTLPALIEHHQKKVVETHLQKFYTVINQAIKLSAVGNGDPLDWDISPGSTYASYDVNKKFFEKYLLKYLKVTKYEQCGDRLSSNYGGSNRVCVWLPDGTAFTLGMDINGIDISVFPFGKVDKNINTPQRKRFGFNFRKSRTETQNIGGVEPYTFKWDGTLEGLYEKCTNESHNFCAKLIQVNGWKIPDDYPW